MAQYLTTITQGKTTWHLSTNGRDIFHSRHYLTGGVIFPELACRDGRIVNRKNLKAASETEMIALLAPIPKTPASMSRLWIWLASLAGLITPQLTTPPHAQSGKKQKIMSRPALSHGDCLYGPS